MKIPHILLFYFLFNDWFTFLFFDYLGNQREKEILEKHA